MEFSTGPLLLYPNQLKTSLLTCYRGPGRDLGARGEVPKARQFAAARLHAAAESRTSRLRVLVPQQPHGQLRR